MEKHSSPMSIDMTAIGITPQPSRLYACIGMYLMFIIPFYHTPQNKLVSREVDLKKMRHTIITAVIVQMTMHRH